MVDSPFLRSSPDIFFCLLPLVYAFLFYTVFGFVCLVPYILKPYPHATRHGRLTQDQTEKKSWVFFCIGLCWSTTTKGGIFHKRDIPPHIEIKDHFVNYILKLKLIKRIHLFYSKNTEQLFDLDTSTTCITMILTNTLFEPSQRPNTKKRVIDPLWPRSNFRSGIFFVQHNTTLHISI